MLEALTWATARLKEAAVEGPRQEARWLLGHVLGRSSGWILSLC